MLAPDSSHQDAVMSKTETESKPKLRWYQYSLRSLVLVVVSALVTASSLSVAAEEVRLFPAAKSGFPAVLRAGSGCSSDADFFPDIVPQHLRKRRVTIEQWI